MKPQKMRRWAAGVLAVLASLSAAPVAAALTPSQLAVVINADDPGSAELAEYYRVARGLAPSHVFTVHLGSRTSAEPAIFMREWRRLHDQLPDGIEALALSWLRPWRVDCLSVTSAMTFGYDTAHCASSCKPTAASPLAARGWQRPWRELGLRPAMLLNAGSPEASRALVDRGVAADGSATGRSSGGTAYLVSTNDKNRNVRARGYADIERRLGGRYPVVIHHGNVLRGRDDVMFYFTGLPKVPDITSNTFLPGAIADHLTSAGGCLVGCGQMSVLRWLEAGATGSYGAVREPCNYPQKFPQPARVIGRYLAGDTLLEAYWRSVKWPGQGLFIGEPLARPFARPISGTER